MIEARRLRPPTDDATAVLAGAGTLAGSYAATGFTPAFVASPVERFLSRTMPGAVVTFAIQRLGSLGQRLNLLTATVLTLLALAAVLRLSMAVGERLGNRAVPVVAGGASVWALTAFLTGAFASAAGAALGAAAVVGTSGGSEADGGPTVPEDAPSEVRENLRTAASRSLDVDGIEPLVSTDFYQVDINAADPDVDAADWSLSITGEVESAQTYSLDDLKSMSSKTAFGTLRCVGEPLNGHKLDRRAGDGPRRTGRPDGRL